MKKTTDQAKPGGDQAPGKKTRYQMIIDGDIEPEGHEKGYKNLETGHKKYNLNVIDPEKRKEICRKGQKAQQELYGKRKTAKEALENVLTLKINDAILEAAAIDEALAAKLKRSNPDATLYDLIQIVAAGKAAGGNIKAAEYIRDTYGDKPKEQIEITENITTDSDRELLHQIASRLNQAESIAIIEEIKQEQPPQ